ncbi:diguanylate cyclase regulator RdcB family protein [Pseudomonas putida]|uniref:diguanylate cyclase regulator RdcB family protein n=1 Tax=Pseudomonas TaxID=286 RepID=UPI00384F3847
MSEQQPITQQSEICQILTCLPEKFVVDFANGIDVARERQAYLKGRTGFAARLFDGFTGQGARHQAEINASLTDGVEGALNWLKDLSESLASSNLAIAGVNDRVNHLKLDVARIATYSIDTRRQLENLADRLTERCDNLDQQVARIDFVQRVQLHLDMVFNKWSAGRFNSFSLSGRCYAALEELRWGAFGDYCRQATGNDRQQLLENLSNRVITHLASDSKVTRKERIATRERWLEKPMGRDVLPEASESLAYLGDDHEPQKSPFVFAVSQVPDELPLHLPRLNSPERMSEAMISELFLEVAHV